MKTDELELNWCDAINYAGYKGKFIPSSEQAMRLRLGWCWTSTTYFENISKAYVHGEKEPAFKTEKRPVILVDKLESTQEISYIIGDVNEQESKEMKLTSKEEQSLAQLRSTLRYAKEQYDNAIGIDQTIKYGIIIRKLQKRIEKRFKQVIFQ